MIEDKFLNPKKNNFLLSICADNQGDLGLSYIDISTGDFHTSVTSISNIQAELTRISPSKEK